MRLESEVGVRRVTVLQVRHELPEPSVLGFANECNPPTERFRRFGRGRDTFDETESELILSRCVARNEFPKGR